MTIRVGLASSVLLLLVVVAASAEVARIDIRSRESFGSYERVIARVHFTVDPTLPVNRAIADLALAVRNANGLVEFSSDLLVFRPTAAAVARGTVFLEVVNRGRDQSLGLLSAAGQSDLSPESWSLGDRFVLEQGFTLAFIGWQFDVAPSAGLTFQVPWVPVHGTVRSSYVATGATRATAFAVSYCAADPSQPAAQLTFRTRIDAAARVLPRETWRFGLNGCSVELPTGFDQGLYEAIYEVRGSPEAGLGFAAMRDFASYLKHGPSGATLREHPDELQRVLGFGYSQSGRFLRELVRDGFNADEQGRAAFDGLFIASAGAGGGSFNHRFARPGDAGNSVLSILRPVDVPPFLDDELLARAKGAGVTPKIFYTFTSTEYWARAGSLTHARDDGSADVPLAASSRLYFLAGTAHASGPFPPGRSSAYQYPINFAEQRWVMRALLMDLDAWISTGTEPPASRYPTLARKELVARESVRFPRAPELQLPRYMPQVWPMDFGTEFAEARVITREPPALGRPYRVLVPQVDDDGNDRGGVRLPEVAVPLGTYTGWNISVPSLPTLQYLAGLIGTFHPFARTEEAREASGDERPSIAARYTGRRDYLNRVARATDALVRDRFIRAEDVPAVLQRSEAMWEAIVGSDFAR